jgi:hypothetical protein
MNRAVEGKHRLSPVATKLETKKMEKKMEK